MKLRVISYNIHRAIGVDRRFRLDRIVSILAHYGAEIVLLQEVDQGVPRSRGLDLAWELASLLDYPYYAAGYNVSLREGQYGNATLSRYPILHERNIDLTIGFRKPRGCQYTCVETGTSSSPDAALQIFNLHLGLSAWERVRQVGRLVQSDEFASVERNQACVVGGDFNDWRSMLTPIFADILGFECATDYKSGRRQAMRTYPSFSPQGGLDKIFCRGGMRMTGASVCRMDAARVASDHLPVIADFEF